MPQVNFAQNPEEFGIGRVWLTASKTRSGAYHTTLRSEDGTYKCSCEGWRYHRKCKHVTFLMEELGDDESDDFQVSL